MKDVFKVAGRVINVEILTDRDNRSKGVATVQFEDPSMALNAICILSRAYSHKHITSHKLSHTVLVYRQPRIYFSLLRKF